jgi:recombination protein RecR
VREGERPETVQRLVEELSRLPGIGRRSAERLADHILRAPKDEALALALAIRDVKQAVVRCTECGNFSEEDPCGLCSDPARDGGVLCVVASPRDLLALERSGAFRGKYHVLEGRMAPLDGAGAGEVGIDGLVARVRSGGVREVVLALDTDAEGDLTSLTVARSLADTGVTVSRIARGLPSGSAIELASSATLGDAFEGRRALEDPRASGS